MPKITRPTPSILKVDTGVSGSCAMFDSLLSDFQKMPLPTRYSAVGAVVHLISKGGCSSVEPDLLRDGRPAERARADGRLALEAAADVAAGQEDDVALKWKSS